MEIPGVIHNSKGSRAGIMRTSAEETFPRRLCAPSTPRTKNAVDKPSAAVASEVKTVALAVPDTGYPVRGSMRWENRCPPMSTKFSYPPEVASAIPPGNAIFPIMAERSNGLRTPICHCFRSAGCPETRMFPLKLKRKSRIPRSPAAVIGAINCVTLPYSPQIHRHTFLSEKSLTIVKNQTTVIDKSYTLLDASADGNNSGFDPPLNPHSRTSGAAVASKAPSLRYAKVWPRSRTR